MNEHPSFTDALRRSTGRRVMSETLAQSEPHYGSVGIGRGGAAGQPRVRDDYAERWNVEIRLLSGLLRGHHSVEQLTGGR